MEHDAEFWRGLLLKYMRAVIARESIMYLDPRFADPDPELDTGYPFELSAAEWAAIDAVDTQARQENELYDQARMDEADADIRELPVIER